MKITRVSANNRKKVFEVTAGRRAYEFPYAKLPERTAPGDLVETVEVDPELGSEAFTYTLRSGVEGSVHVDTVREVAEDPDYLQELFLHRLTLKLGDELAGSGIGVREASRQLRTSPSQVYRLLDPDNSHKSLGQVLALLHLAEREVTLSVRPRATDHDARHARFEIYRTRAGKFRFRMVDSEGKRILVSRSFASRRACLKEIESVQAAAADLSVVMC